MIDFCQKLNNNKTKNMTFTTTNTTTTTTATTMTTTEITRTGINLKIILDTRTIAAMKILLE